MDLAQKDMQMVTLMLVNSLKIDQMDKDNITIIMVIFIKDYFLTDLNMEMDILNVQIKLTKVNFEIKKSVVMGNKQMKKENYIKVTFKMVLNMDMANCLQMESLQKAIGLMVNLFTLRWGRLYKINLTDSNQLLI